MCSTKKSRSRTAPDAGPARRLAGAVEFRDVEMAYEPGHPVLPRYRPSPFRPGSEWRSSGRRVAGKSALVSLLCRLRDPDAGGSCIDGHDLLRPHGRLAARADRDRAAGERAVRRLRRARTSLCGSPDPVTDEQIVAAARLAGAHEFILALPEGYDTVVGERGATLSGGQRQRIAIARAAIRDAPIVILDEAMTGLDSETEAEVSAALDRLTAGRTTFVITHDLDAVRDCEQVIWVERGRVARSGRPDQVLGRTPVLSAPTSSEEARPRRARPRRAAAMLGM